MGVEPTGDGVTRRPPVLKTGAITGMHALPSSKLVMQILAAYAFDQKGRIKRWSRRFNELALPNNFLESKNKRRLLTDAVIPYWASYSVWESG